MYRCHGARAPKKEQKKSQLSVQSQANSPSQSSRKNQLLYLVPCPVIGLLLVVHTEGRNRLHLDHPASPAHGLEEESEGFANLYSDF
ncbi:uncharacterized protein BDV17DRAFT_265642 [Aspergillus undulatus]|uniref:uncharacterized protein n=1 Tax=Aspergillus undulatus TaxID=1810928 RepID=UPI003CCCCC49